MAKKKIKLYFQSYAGDLYKQIVLMIREAGGILSGNIRSGSISIPTPIGKIISKYKIIANEIEIEIIEKPFLVGYGKIESKLKGYISKID